MNYTSHTAYTFTIFFLIRFCGFSCHFAVFNFFIAWKRCTFTNLVSSNRGRKTMVRQAEVVNQRKSTKRKCIIVKCTHQKRNDYIISHSTKEKLICVICIYVFFSRKKMHGNRMHFVRPLRGGTEKSHGSKRESKIILYRSKSRVKADNDNYQKWNKAKNNNNAKKKWNIWKIKRD